MDYKTAALMSNNHETLPCAKYKKTKQSELKITMSESTIIMNIGREIKKENTENTEYNKLSKNPQKESKKFNDFLKKRLRHKIYRAAAATLIFVSCIVGCGSDHTQKADIEHVAENNIPDDENGIDEKENIPTDENAIDEKENTPAGENEIDKKENIPTDENAIDEKENIPTGENTIDEKENTATGDAIYDSVLAQYQDMVQNNFYIDLLGSDDYESSFGEDVHYEIRSCVQNIFYAFYDIDKNGTKELIITGAEPDIGVANPAFSPHNYDLYGYDGSKVVHLFPEMDFGYRTNFSLYEDGVIEVFYTSSAAESGVDFYKISEDGFTPELVDSFVAIGHLEGEEAVFQYFRNNNEITEEQYHTEIQSYTVALSENLEWKEIY